MKYCVYADGSTEQVENGSLCVDMKGSSPLTDEFEIPDSDIEVHNNLFWVNIAIVALFILPSLLGKKR